MMPAKLNRTERAVLRHTAIIALRNAMPSLKMADIARLLNIDNGTVRHHIKGGYKGARPESAPLWHSALVAGCTALSCGNLAEAYVKFHDVALTIDTMNRKQQDAEHAIRAA